MNLIQDRVQDIPLHAWFLDDGTCVGSLDQLREVVDIVVSEGPNLGLILSTSATVPPPGKPKSTIWRPTIQGGDGAAEVRPGTSQSGEGVAEVRPGTSQGGEGPAEVRPGNQQDPLERGLIFVTEEGVTLLGAPLGSHGFVSQQIQKKVDKIKAITDLLPLLEDSQTEFVLLRSCLSLPKISFLLRAVDTSPHIALLQEFDQVTREALIRILGAPVGDRVWQQGKIPVSMGGLGLRAAEDHAPAAYAASVLSAQLRVQDLVGGRQVVDGEEDVLGPEALGALSVAQGEQEQLRVADLAGMTQRQMSVRVDLHQQRRLMEMVGEGEEREQARLLAVALDHTGDWLNTPPLKAL